MVIGPHRPVLPVAAGDERRQAENHRTLADVHGRDGLEQPAQGLQLQGVPRAVGGNEPDLRAPAGPRDDHDAERLRNGVADKEVVGDLLDLIDERPRALAGRHPLRDDVVRLVDDHALHPQSVRCVGRPEIKLLRGRGGDSHPLERPRDESPVGHGLDRDLAEALVAPFHHDRVGDGAVGGHDIGRQHVAHDHLPLLVLHVAWQFPRDRLRLGVAVRLARIDDLVLVRVRLLYRVVEFHAAVAFQVVVDDGLRRRIPKRRCGHEERDGQGKERMFQHGGLRYAGARLLPRGSSCTIPDAGRPVAGSLQNEAV